MYGVWAVKGIFMYSNVLEIKRDGTFNFLEGGCTGSRFTEGNWQGSGYTCVLRYPVLFI